MIPPFLIKPAIGAAAVVALAGAFFGWLHFVHDPDIRAAYVAEIAALTAKQQAADQAAALAAVQQAGAEQAQREATRTIIRERIIRVPVTMACANSNAIGVAIDGLRTGGSGAGAPSDPAIPAGLPGTAGAAPRPVR